MRGEGRLAVIGLGLIGGSLAWAARRSGAYQEVSGYDLAPGVAERALEMGVVDVVAPSPAAAARRAELVVVATPPLTVSGTILEVAAHVRPGTVVTDVAGFKGELLKAVSGKLPTGVAYVGGHPMAGSERSGLGAADPRLFAGAAYAVIGPAESAATEMVVRLARNVGGRPILMEAAAHDRAVAVVSHLPYLLAVGLCLAAEEAGPEAVGLAAGAFRDATRVAAGPPEVGRGMCVGNAADVVEAWARVRTFVDGLVADLDEVGGVGETDPFERARFFRRRLFHPALEEEGGR